MDIEGKFALVTGAASGIGQATAIALARAGASGVAVVDLGKEWLEGTTERIEETGARALALDTDVSDLESLRLMFGQIDGAFGRLDILHNNAGMGEGPAGWPDLDPIRSARIIDVNLRGVILGTQLALPLMKRGGGGVIIATASGGAFMPLPPQAVYVATKAGVVHFTRSCVPLLESHGVRVNCVCPGLVETPMIYETGGDSIADWLKPVYDSVKLLEPDDIANAVLEIVRDDSQVGEVISVNNEGEAAQPLPR